MVGPRVLILVESAEACASLSKLAETLPWARTKEVAFETSSGDIEQAVAGQRHDLVALDDVGHYPQVERPDLVAARIRELWRATTLARGCGDSVTSIC